MAPFSKPETVLKQAEGLVSVGQTHAALQSLTELFSSKRFRSAPLASLEPIMARFVELCVDLRKGRTAKDGLMQYKNIAQNSNVGSIELVISKFLALADAKVQQAQAQAAREVALTDVDDLEASETPESILLGAVSGDQSKDRTDRALVTPWLKFLWESYRTALETLKNNARLELIYQQTAQKAFQFCLKHQRKVEFRRLCETLRLHLQNVAKYAHQLHAVNLSDPDTLQRHLDTRFAQLHASIQLELWQEAFRSVEDVHNLLTMAKKAPRPSMMAGYYEQLAQVFLMSGNALYHAAAWAKYHQVVSSIGGRSAEDTEKLAGKVLIATLAVPVGQAADDESRSKSARLMSLLGLTKAPTRATLLKDALSRHVLKLAPENIRALYSALEVTFDPLALPGAAAPLLAKLAEDSAGEYARYLPLVRKALLSRLLSQLAQVYSSITISSLLELLVPLRTGDVDAFDDAQVEAYIMGCARRGELHIRVDHAAGSINFSDDVFAESEVSTAGPSSSPLVQTKNSEQVQPSTSELVRTRLSRTATALHTALAKLHPTPLPTPSEQAAQLQALVTAANAERESLRLRRALVARRRELLQELSARKEQEEASRRADAAKRRKVDDERRAADDARRKAQEHAQKEMQSIRDNEVRVLAENLKARNILKVDLGDMKDVNTDMLMKLQVEQMEKEKRELADKTRTVAKRLDHLERALRKEERPLLAQDYAQQQASDKKTFEALQKARIEGARAEHAHNLETKARLARMTDDYAAHLETVSSRRGAEFTKKREKAFRKIEEEKAKRRAQVLAKREADKLAFEEEERLRAEQEAEEERLAAEREAEEERLRAEAEAAAEAEAEKKRAEEETRAAARKQRELERQEAAESARRQQEREEEAERRRKERKAAPPPAAAAPTPVRASASAEPDVWRRAPRADGPARTESPRPGAAGGAPIAASASAGGAYKPPFAAAGRGAGGGWREREAARQAAAGGGAGAPRPASPAPAAAAQASPAPATRKLPEPADDGFQTVEKKPAGGVWRSSRGRGRGL